MTLEELQRAADHIRAGDFTAARSILIPYVRAHPDSDNAWVLLSFAVAQREDKLKCLEKALAVNPENEQARARWDQFRTPEKGQGARVPPFADRFGQGIGSEEGTGPGLMGGDRPPAFVEGSADFEPDMAGSDLSGDRSTGAGRADPIPQPTADSTQTGRDWTRPVLLILGLLACAGLAGVLAVAYSLFSEFRLNLDATQSVVRAQVAASVATEGGSVVLPPSWTPTDTPTITLTPTPEPTRTPTATPTLIPPDLEERMEMDTIQVEVADLRGLSPQRDVASYLLTKSQVRPILETMFISNGGTPEEVADQKRQMVALGLVKPTYNLYDNILNSLADGIGGFFDPQSEQLFVIGSRFGGIEHYIFSHEFDHALVDQHFPLDQLGVYPLCLRDEDQCRAISALVEGDASLLMEQWWQQYASPQDYEDIFNYRPPWYTLPEQFPPPASVRDANFPYIEGYLFVRELYERGNWAEVNAAYSNLPASTEHILHPGKYFSREAPVEVAPVDLTGLLGEGWRQLTVDTLGEWGTYLLLGYSADNAAQVGENTAVQASEGWGGDTYQIYFHDEGEQTLLVSHWIGDSVTDGSQFHSAMLTYLDARFRGARLDRSEGDCWEVNQETTCLFRSGAEVLWLLAPDQSLLDQVLARYAQFP